MFNLDNKNVGFNEVKAKAFEAFKGGTDEEQKLAFEELFDQIAVETKAAAEQKTSELYEAINDEQILVNRGVARAMTTEEKKYFKAAAEKQKLDGLNELFPKTIVMDIMKDLTEEHPIISKVDTRYTEAVLEYVYGDPTKPTAFWSELPADIRQILLGAFKRVSLQVAKLSAYIALPKAYFQLGPNWLANYVTTALREAIEVALETAIISGDGKMKPIGMTRKLSGSVDGVYPVKTPITVGDFKPTTLAGIRATMAAKKTDNGAVEWIVHPETYWSKFYPNLAFQTQSGAWVTTTLPTGENIVQSYAVEKDQAIVGVLKNYLLAVAGNVEITKYTETLAIEDMDVFIGKMFTTGVPKNENAFFVADLSTVVGATPVTAEDEADVKPEDRISPATTEPLPEG